MKRLFSWKFIIVLLILVVAFTSYRLLIPRRIIDFSTEVKPILNKKCITCHGGVKKQAGFSVLFREDMFAPTKSGKLAVIPGDPDGSEMIRRITLTDPEERMPFKHPPLSKGEIDILRTWIKQGAKWGDHWAYIPVKEVEIPEVKDKWVKNDVDKFILEKIEKENLKPSPQADKAALLRRVSLDLIGMLPPDSIARQYLQSSDDKAYDSLVDSLLASKRFGERWTSMWLDLARYADTKGYEADMGRSVWQYRDWVIKAFNEDKPYDDFLKEQIAGDLLPNPTDAQYIATAFHRNTMSNDEGGTNNEEFRTAAVIDRVNTTWEALMGTTFGCVQCHSHPYDPFKHDEYYNFMAYFNNTRDEDVPSEFPLLRLFNDTLKQELSELNNWVKKVASGERAREIDLFVRTWEPAIYSYIADSLTNAAVEGNNSALIFRNHAVARLKHIDLSNIDQFLYHFSTLKKGGGILKLHIDAPDGTLLGITAVRSSDKKQTVFVDFPKQTGVHDIFITYENSLLPKKNDDFVLDFGWFAITKQFPGEGMEGYEANKKLYLKLLNAEVPIIPVMVENPGSMFRRSNVFERGNWRVKGKEVGPAIPGVLKFAMPANAPKNRIGLAMWLTDKRNPLVARTMVNRLWEQLFGAGIVETLEDMGTQGIAPTHRELLDHLAWKFMNDYKWSVKKLLRELVMSATYQQESKLTEELKEKDMFNKLYARGPRIRLTAEQLRDQDLCISGVMSKKMFGPGVMPWQPQGIWLSPYNDARWENSKGDEQYRRAVYTYLKRSALYPSMLTFDGAPRVVCTARRIRTNTPLQALATLNDSAYLDMSRHFAYRMQKEAGKDVQLQIARGYELMLYKKIPAAKLLVFEDLYKKALDEFKTDADKTCEIIGMDNENNNPETAALVVVANAMLNLDEVVMKN
ncbi:MAG: hypothetical protein JWM28_2177 [Chitinophagaceae bacterium]|nr:hypothetical protein [Chitinophagaceae bacterium]